MAGPRPSDEPVRPESKREIWLSALGSLGSASLREVREAVDRAVDGSRAAGGRELGARLLLLSGDMIGARRVLDGAGGGCQEP